MQELDVIHSASRTVVQSAQFHEKQFGDSTSTLIIFASSLLEHCLQLLNLVLFLLKLNYINKII